MTRRQRWPRWVYGTGQEPDVRFTMANERTFLAWIRTAMAFLAGGIAIDVVKLDWPEWLQRALAVGLLLLGIVSATGAWLRWARSERALRTGRPLPSMSAGMVLTFGLVAAGAALVAVTLL